MKTVLFTGLAATALLGFASALEATDSWGIENTTSAAATIGTVANGRKPGTIHNPGSGMPKPMMPHMVIHRPNHSPMAHGPRPGMHGIPKTDV